MKQGLFLIFAFCAISNAYAQMDCESIPSCAELGYTQASCPEGSASLKCPFDETKFYCIGGKKLSDAPAPVVTPEDWTAECADTIAHCITLDSSCRCTACESGYLLSNGNCVAECAKSVAICAKESKIFKADTCTCESCPTNYLPVDGVCKKMCTVVANCTDYNDDCACTACENGFTLDNGVCVSECFKKCKPLAGFYNGKPATDWMLKASQRDLVSYSLITNGLQKGYLKPHRGKDLKKGDYVGDGGTLTALFYVGDKNGDFGQGKWYIPTIGEWLDILGVKRSDLEKIYGSSTASLKGYRDLSPIDDALETLINAGVYAKLVNDGDYYVTASFVKTTTLTVLLGTPNIHIGTGKVAEYDGYHSLSSYVRLVTLVKNVSQGAQAPQIGDVLYTDKSYGNASNYDKSKTPAGIIFAVSNDKKDVKIISLGVVGKSFSYFQALDGKGGRIKLTPPADYSEGDNVGFARQFNFSNLSTRDINQWAMYSEGETAVNSDTLSALQEAASSGCTCEFEVPLCPEGYIFNQSGDCIKGQCILPDHCSKAVGDDFDCVCTTCERNYHLVDGECLPNNDKCLSYSSSYPYNCAQCQVNSIANCEEYDTNSSNQIDYCSCKTCESGFEYAYDSTNGVEKCVRKKTDGKCYEYAISNCDELAEDFCSCQKCSSGYVLTESGDCQCPVIENCSYYNKDCSCWSCKAGYVKKDGKCMYHCGTSVNDMSNCKVIEDTYVDDKSLCTCSVCTEGYLLMNDGKCFNKSLVNRNSKCTTWNSSKQCIGCKDGYSLNENNYCI